MKAYSAAFQSAISAAALQGGLCSTSGKEARGDYAPCSIPHPPKNRMTCLQGSSLDDADSKAAAILPRMIHQTVAARDQVSDKPGPIAYSPRGQSLPQHREPCQCSLHRGHGGLGNSRGREGGKQG